LKLKYLPYQKECIKFVEEHNGYAINGDTCGLGKTIEAIGTMDISYPGKYIIICTKSMKLKWAREIYAWTKKDSYIISGEKQFTLPKNYNYYIINYHILGKENANDRKLENKRKEDFNKNELLRKKECEEKGEFYKKAKYIPGIIRLEGWFTELSKLNITGIIIDEAHRGLNNPKAIWTRSIIELYKAIKPKVFLPLTGTPIRKRPKNFYTMLHLTAPNLFPNEYKFYYRYCDPKHTRWGWTFDGATHEEELHELVSKIMIRRLKEDVLKELPDKIFSCIPMELTKLEEKNYLSTSEELIRVIKSTKNKLEKSNGLAKLKQLAYLAKRNSLFTWIDEFMEDNDKLILGCWHKMVINDLMERYGKIALKIDGSVTDKNRQIAEDRFQTDPKIKIIILQIDAGGEGLTLTASKSVGIIECPDTPGQIIQFCDRAHRKGQTEQVTVYFPFANGTIENIVADRIEESFRSMSMILDGKESKGIFNYSFDDVLLKNL
jgi:SWI/SNF-related matrix-associated actin-dependent regulator 1 of chromatin subfamily A